MNGYATVKSADQLSGHRTHFRYTVEDLTDAVNRQMRKDRVRGERLESCSKSLIGHLCSGRNRNTSLAKARAIEQVFNVPTGTLFDHYVACSAPRSDVA